MKIFRFAEDVTETNLDHFQEMVIGLSVIEGDGDYPEIIEEIAEFEGGRYEGQDGIYIIAKNEKEATKVENGHLNDMAKMWRELDRD